MTEPPIILQAVAKAHGKAAARVMALNGIDAAIDAECITALVGPSGSGKSTMLNLIGLLDTPTSGEIRLFGAPAPADTAAREAMRRTDIGFVFQSFNLIATLTSRENVELALLLSVSDRGARRARATAALGSVGMADMADRFPHQLSGGQQQRVAIARAIVHRPRLILADEPTANLDRQSADRVLDLFGQLRAAHNCTVIISSHDPRVAAIADRTVALVDGRIADERMPLQMEAVA